MSFKYFFFTEKKICLPTLPKIFEPVTRNTLIFLFGLTMVNVQKSELFLFPNKMYVIGAGIHKMLVIMANREDPDQTASLEAV